MKCFVLWCKNSFVNNPRGVSFHRIPQNMENEWLQAIRRPLDHPHPSRRICSEHFTPECFLTVPGKTRILKPNAIPSIKLRRQVQLPMSIQPDIPGVDKPTEATTSHHQNIDEMQKKRKIDDTTSSSDSQGLTGTPKKRRRLVRMFHNYSLSPRKMKQNLCNIKEQKDKIVKQLKVSKARVKRLSTKITHLKQVITALGKKNMMSDESLSVLDKTFNHIPLALMRRLVGNLKKGKTNKAPFPPELRSFAMTLQFYSSKAYQYVRKTFGFALPAPSTIRSWLSNIHCEPGFAQTAFETLKRKVAENTSKNMKTLCCLMLDEMSLKKQVEFQSNKIWGYVDLGTGIEDGEMHCATETLVLMVVSLTENWKIPIAYFLINALGGKEKANIIKTALKMLSEINITIVSITSDGPSANFSMAQELGAKLNISDSREIQSYFLHPITRQKVFIILDACHMLKLIRNNWSKLNVIVDKDGNEIRFDYIQKLYETQESISLRVANKLRKSHIEWTKQKMKVNLAAQTLSSSVADALEFCCKDLCLQDFQHVEATVKFIRVIDRLFDLCNSRNAYASGYKGPLRKNNELFWSCAFTESIDYLKGLKNSDGVPLYTTRNSTPIRGFIITATSLMGVYDTYIKTDDSINYLLTYKMSQDHLELFFFTVRSHYGSNNNPTPYQFHHTFKRLMLYHDIKQDGGNCLSIDSTTILSVSSISKPNQQEVSIDELGSMKKYGFDKDKIVDDHDYGQEFSPFFDTITENVLTYLGGFVVRKMKTIIKCEKCLLALEIVVNNTREDFPDFTEYLINRKNRGGLIKPSSDIISIVRFVELQIKIFLSTTDNKLPNHKNFYEKFNLHCYLKFMEFNNDVFSNLADHYLDHVTFSENHTSILVKLVIKIYSRLRFYEVSKKQTEIERGTLIRKQFSKLILFQNQ